LEQRDQLIHGLAVVRLIEQSIQLGGGCPQPAHDLALRERALRDPLLRFDRQPVQQEIPEVRRGLAVFEHLFDVSILHGRDIRGQTMLTW
jgi:hypothetical protein